MHKPINKLSTYTLTEIKAWYTGILERVLSFCWQTFWTCLADVWHLVVNGGNMLENVDMCSKMLGNGEKLWDMLGKVFGCVGNLFDALRNTYESKKFRKNIQSRQAS